LSDFVTFISLVFLIMSPAMAEENPFVAVQERDQWAIEQVVEHKADSGIGNSNVVDARGGKKTGPKALATATPFLTKNYSFQTETDEAKVSILVTDFGSNFVIDVSSDQAIQGWLLKRQSTREVFLKGGTPSDNPYKCRIRVERPYIKDFGLTVYVTQDSDPAFVQLF
jgi:hypothetical protein